MVKKLGHPIPCGDPCCGHFKERGSCPEHKDAGNNHAKVTQGVAAQFRDGVWEVAWATAHPMAGLPSSRVLQGAQLLSVG